MSQFVVSWRSYVHSLLLIGVGVGFPAFGAYAQTSNFDGVASSLTAMSLQSSVDDAQRQIIGNTVLGPPGPIGTGADATGRIRKSSHDGFTAPPNVDPAGRTYGVETLERSAFGIGTYQLPGTWLGGSIKVSALVGGNWLGMKLAPNALNPTPPKGQIGSAENTSAFFGGNLLWFSSLGYVSAIAVGHRGDATAQQSSILDVSYNTNGILTNLVVGRVTPLTMGPSALKFDLRGSLGFTKISGSTFDTTLLPVPPGFPHSFDRFSFSTASAGISPMLFADLVVDQGTVRPYVQGNIKKLFGYSNTSDYTSSAFATDVKNRFGEDLLFTSVELGLNYAAGNWTLGAAYYLERSSDVHTIGGKVGASYKFN